GASARSTRSRTGGPASRRRTVSASARSSRPAGASEADGERNEQEVVQRRDAELPAGQVERAHRARVSTGPSGPASARSRAVLAGFYRSADPGPWQRPTAAARL